MRMAFDNPMQSAYTQRMITGADVYAARKNLGESQAAFGARFGVDQSTVHRWEKYGVPNAGTTRMAIETILANIPATVDADLKIQSVQAE